MIFERRASFSVANATRKEAKLTCVRLNTQTPCPPCGAVPVNTRVWLGVRHSARRQTGNSPSSHRRPRDRARRGLRGNKPWPSALEDPAGRPSALNGRADSGASNAFTPTSLADDSSRGSPRGVGPGRRQTSNLEQFVEPPLTPVRPTLAGPPVEWAGRRQINNAVATFGAMPRQ